MHLGKAIEHHLTSSTTTHTHDEDAKRIVLLVERWLRHNNYHAAADALETEHMP